MFIGNTAEEVLNSVNCSVLTVKPDGFKTPVTID
jgi:nucleotide-binding universal stress UspA family protein